MFLFVKQSEADSRTQADEGGAHLPPHTFAFGRLREALRAVLARDERAIRKEKPVLRDCRKSLIANRPS
jgi:hypothetical protein